MKWHSYGCKCGSAIEVRCVTGVKEQECPECLSPMVHLASWHADGQRYDAKGKVVAEAMAHLIDLGVDPDQARVLSEIMGPAVKTFDEAVAELVRRKALL